MKLINAVEAYTALEAVSALKLDAQSAYNAYKVKVDLKPHILYFMSEEMKIANRYGKKNANGILQIENGRVLFAGKNDDEKAENALKYNTERAKVCDIEIDLQCDKSIPIHIPKDARIATATIEALEHIMKVVIDGSAI